MLHLDANKDYYLLHLVPYSRSAAPQTACTCLPTHDSLAMGLIATDMGHGWTGALSESERQLLPWRRLLRPRLRRHLVRVVQEAGRLVRSVPHTGWSSQVRQLPFRRHRQQDRPGKQRGLECL